MSIPIVVSATVLSYYFILMTSLTRLLTFPLLLMVMTATNSCSTLSYYQQSISGHLAIMSKRQPIDALLQQKDLAAGLREKLKQSVAIRKYASDVLFLPDNDSYSTYADLGRNYVLWNVVATPEFSLEPLRWCYVVVGCLSYRGYFSRTDAIQYAEKLKSDGDDVYVAGVSAYSTLGWFSDPVVNPMLKYDSTYLARVIFHELAHQLIYFSNDTEFNEAFADTVAEYGVRRWLQDEHMKKEGDEFEQSLARENEFNRLVKRYRSKLEELYGKSPAGDDLRRRKQAVFANMKSDYEKMRGNWHGNDDYQAWFGSGLNNAKLALVLTYQDLVPGFLKVLARENYDLKRFYRSISTLKSCDKPSRRRFLDSNSSDFSC